MTLSHPSFAFAATLLAATGAADIPTGPNQVQPLPVGARAPAFSARTKNGAVRTFSPGGYHKPTIVIFYRGGWCPYCNTQLNDLRHGEPKLRQRIRDHVPEHRPTRDPVLEPQDDGYSLHPDLIAGEGGTRTLDPGIIS